MTMTTMTVVPLINAYCRLAQLLSLNYHLLVQGYFLMQALTY
jgi:hypothetical protein